MLRENSTVTAASPLGNRRGGGSLVAMTSYYPVLRTSGIRVRKNHRKFNKLIVSAQ
jgi:hypothetical protein